MRYVCILLLAVTTSHAADNDFNPAKLSTQVQAIAETVLPAIVACKIKGAPQGHFSAVIVSAEGHVLTAAHCITSRPPNMKNRKPEDLVFLLTLMDGRTLEADALGWDRSLDCGLMKIRKPENLPIAEMGNSAGLVQNQPCFGISHPGSFDEDRGAVLRFGHVNETITERAGMIQSTCLTEPGDSGGALFDMNGRIIGIHSQIDKDLDRNYHVRVSAFHEHWDRLKQPGQFRAGSTPGIPVLGFQATFDKTGLKVRNLKADGIASSAGLKNGDYILQLDGEKIRSVRHFNKAYIKLVRAGRQTIPVTIKAGEERKESAFRLPDRKTPLNSPVPELADLPAWFAELENKLDDVTFLISSPNESQPLSVLGTLIGSGGHIVSKSSRVGRTPIVKLRTGARLATTVLARDEANDLVLLQCEKLVGEPGVRLPAEGESPSTETLGRGRMLVTPNPRGAAFVSVVGSAPFDSKGTRGYLGVGLNVRDGKVVIQSVDPRAPAGRAGFRVGDQLVSVNGTPITKPTDVTQAMKDKEAGTAVVILLERNGAQLGKRIKVGYRDIRRHAADFLTGGKSGRRNGFETVFSHDGTLQPKDCGSPVYDIDGTLLGLNIARHSRAQCYAIPIHQVSAFVRATLTQVNSAANESR